MLPHSFGRRQYRAAWRNYSASGGINARMIGLLAIMLFRRSIFPGNMDMVRIRKFGLAVGLSGSDTQIWSGGGFEWSRYAILDKLCDDWLNYPEGAFSRLFDFCIVPGFWINSMFFGSSYTIFGSFSLLLGSVCDLVAGYFFHFPGVLYHESIFSPIRSG